MHENNPANVPSQTGDQTSLRRATSIEAELPAKDAIAAAVQGAERPVWTLDLGGDDVLAVAKTPPNLVLVLGAEGQGVGSRAAAIAQRTVGIRLAEGVESLNVAVAAGIAVAHLMRGNL